MFSSKAAKSTTWGKRFSTFRRPFAFAAKAKFCMTWLNLKAWQAACRFSGAATCNSTEASLAQGWSQFTFGLNGLLSESKRASVNLPFAHIQSSISSVLGNLRLGFPIRRFNSEILRNRELSRCQLSPWVCFTLLLTPQYCTRHYSLHQLA